MRSDQRLEQYEILVSLSWLTLHERAHLVIKPPEMPGKLQGLVRRPVLCLLLQLPWNLQLVVYRATLLPADVVRLWFEDRYPMFRWVRDPPSTVPLDYIPFSWFEEGYKPFWSRGTTTCDCCKQNCDDRATVRFHQGKVWQGTLEYLNISRIDSDDPFDGPDVSDVFPSLPKHHLVDNARLEHQCWWKGLCHFDPSNAWCKIPDYDERSHSTTKIRIDPSKESQRCHFCYENTVRNEMTSVFQQIPGYFQGNNRMLFSVSKAFAYQVCPECTDFYGQLTKHSVRKMTELEDTCGIPFVHPDLCGSCARFVGIRKRCWQIYSSIAKLPLDQRMSAISSGEFPQLDAGEPVWPKVSGEIRGLHLRRFYFTGEEELELQFHWRSTLRICAKCCLQKDLSVLFLRVATELVDFKTFDSP